MAGTHTKTGGQNNGVKTVDSAAEADRVTLVDAAGAAVDMSVPPAGAATSAKQDTGNASLDSIDSKLTGAPNAAVTQVAAGAVSGPLIAARATRRVFVVRNHDAANSCYIGKGVVTSANGFLLKAGESVSIESVEAWACIRDTADVALGVIELYD
jgi:hypothetical protein